MNMSEAKLYQFPVRYNPDPTGGDNIREIGEPSIRTSSTDLDVSSSQREISTKELYPLASEINPILATAFHLLEEGVGHINLAIRKLEEGDSISSDDEVQHFQALLPELFCCRNLGDGFGAIISSVFHSLRNLDGNPANDEQLKAIKNIVCRISTEPFILFDEAVNEIIKLEDVGLTIEPEHYKFAADLLIE